jgi:ribonuclease J
MTLDHESPVEGVLISHSHQDHCGLLQELPANWPVYCGAATESLIKIYSALSNHVPSKTFFHLENEKPVYVGPFKVTPYLVDHSAFDAHALMVEIRGVKIFYSGDFRDHGRKANLTERLMTYPPKDVDVLIMEGTNLSGDEKIPRGDIVSETELEDKFSDLFMECKGRVFVSYSSANIDRLVTLYRACSKSGRVLVVDLFSMQMLIKLGEFAKIPQPDWKGGKIKAVVTNKMKGVVSRIGEPGFLERLIAQHAAMSAKNLSADPKKWVIISRDSLIDDYGRSGVTPTEGDVWVWSMWKGYLDRESTAKQREFLAPCRSEYLHSSGHASPDTLRRFASAMNPKMLIPVHSNAWGSEAAGFPNVLRVSDGEWVMVK